MLPRRFPKLTERVPAPLIALVSSSLAVLAVHHFWPTFSVATIGSRFQSEVGGHLVAGIPPLPPTPMLPWSASGLSLGALSALGSAAFAIAMLGAIESLLSAVIADGMTGKKHDPDAELIGLGLGNIVAPFFGGIAATGALARTATNVRAGARSPVARSSIPSWCCSRAAIRTLLAYVPMASLAALLLLVAWNMSERRHFMTIVRIAPKSDVLVLVTCFALTILFDMIMAVSFGVVLASLLFMRRTAELTHSRLLEAESAGETEHVLPPGVALYEVAGPLFFGAAQHAMSALGAVGPSNKVVVLALGRVPSIDATGLVALESALVRLRHAGKRVVITGPLPQPQQIFDKANLPQQHSHLSFAPTLEDGLVLARQMIESEADHDATPRNMKKITTPVTET